MTGVIVLNSTIEWLGIDENTFVLERVLWLDATGKQVVVMPLFNPKALPLWKDARDIERVMADGEAVKRTVDPYSGLITAEAEILQKHRERRDRAWEMIKDLVEDEPDIYRDERRGRLVAETAERFGVHKGTIYKYLRRYWAGGKTKNALLPAYDRCGAPGRERKISDKSAKRGRPPKIVKLDGDRIGVNIDEDIKRIFRAGTKMFYNNKDKAPLTRAYQQMIEKFFSVGFREDEGVQIPILPPANELPTFGQYRYWYSKELDLRKSITAREGERGFALRKRAVLGNSTQMAFGPGSLYQIDATIVSVYLVSSFNRSQIIGKPVLYVVIDVLSRMVAGLYIGLEGPGWVGAMMALANAAADKVSFCAEYGIEISPQEWLCRHLPEAILADRGELEGINADHLVDSLNITMANTPPYRADWKGIVEQHFRLDDLKVIHWLPGAVRERFRERGERDYRLDATLDLHQFTKIMIYTALQYNLHHRMEWYPRDDFMVSEGVEPIPIELWNWGIANRSGHLREVAPDIVRLSLMPRDQAAVTPKGIRFKGMYYSCERALLEQWFEKARVYGQWTVPVSFDPRSTDVIYLCPRDGREIEPCQLLKTQELYKGRRLEEVLELQELERMQHALRTTDEMQSKAELNARIKAVVAEAKEQTEAAGSGGASNRQRIKNIRRNRAEEKEQIRQEEAWILNDKDKAPGSEIKSHEPPRTENGAGEKNSSWREKDFEMLKRLRKERGDQ